MASAEKREREKLQQQLAAARSAAGEVGALQSELAGLRGKFDATMKTLETARAEAGQSAQNLAEVRKNFHVLEIERDEARKEAAGREEALGKAAQDLEAAQHELDRLKQDAAETAAEQERTRRAQHATSEEARGLQARADSLLDSLHQREREVADTAQALAAARIASAELRTQLTEKDAALERAQQKIGELQNALATAAEAHAGTTALAADLETARKALAEVCQAAQEAEAGREQLAAKLTASETEARDALAKAAQAQEQEQAGRTRTAEAAQALAAAQEKNRMLAGEGDRLSALA